MNISNWPLNKIMQLPDWCFGRSWLVVVGGNIPTAADTFAISPEALPEWCVIWELVTRGEFLVDSGFTVGMTICLALTDRVPTTVAEFLLCEELFNFTDPANNNIPTFPGFYAHRKLRLPVHSMGRRLAGYFYNPGTVAARVGAYLTVSSIPTEVPDWLVSG